MKELQKILNDNGFTHVKVIDRDTVQIRVDGELELISRYNIVSGHPMSGLRHYAGFYGDHRMIDAIADDMNEVFNLLK